MALKQTNLMYYVILFAIVLVALVWVSQTTCEGCLAKSLAAHGYKPYHVEGINLCKELRTDGHCQVNGTPDLRKVVEQALRDIYAEARGLPPE